MVKNAQYVIYAYGIAGTVLIIYAAALYLRLRLVQKKINALKDKE